jgi:hypothetical protein
VESAQALAKRVLKEGGVNDTERVAYAFRLCTSRKPNADESAVLLKLLAKEQQHIADGWVSALDLSGMRGATQSTDITPTRAAAWTAVARVILNLDETLTKE